MKSIIPMRQRRVSRAIVILSLTIATLAVYARTFGYGYVVLDDAQYVYQNAIVRQGLSRAGAICAFTTFWCANWHANEAEKLARTAGVRILDLVDQGLLESILFNVHRGGGRTEYWIRRESLNRWIAIRDLGLAGYMPRAEAQRSLGLKNITCRSPEWCPGEHISGAGAQLAYKDESMLWLMLALFTWLRSFIRSRHDLGLEIVALRQQLIVLKRRTKRGAFAPF